MDPTRTSGLDPVRVHIVDLCDDAGVANKSLRARARRVRVRKFVRSRRLLAHAGSRPTATLVMRAIYSLQPGPIQVRRDTARSPVPSYSNRIFQEQFSITTTVLTKPFPSCKMHEHGSFLSPPPPSLFLLLVRHLSPPRRRRRNLDDREPSGRRQRSLSSWKSAKLTYRVVISRATCTS